MNSMADRNEIFKLDGLRRAIQDKEREICELDLMLADYRTEHTQLVRELRRLRAQLRNEEEEASSVSKP